MEIDLWYVLVNNLGKDKQVICSVLPGLEFTDISVSVFSFIGFSPRTQRIWNINICLMDILFSNYAKTFIFLYQTREGVFSCWKIAPRNMNRNNNSRKIILNVHTADLNFRIAQSYLENLPTNLKCMEYVVKCSFLAALINAAGCNFIYYQ